MDIDEQIVNWIDGEMSEQEQEAFVQLLKDNPEIDNQNKQYQEIITAIRSKGEKQLRSELDMYLKEHLQKGVPKVKLRNLSLFWYGGIAATILLVIVFFYQTQQNDSAQPMKFQMNQAPVKADSAIFKVDSLTIEEDSL